MGMSVADIVAKWTQNTTGAVDRYKKGIQNTTVDPTALAAAAVDDYLAGVQAAVASNKWQSGLARAGRAGWQAGAIGKGVANIPSGVRQAQDKMTKFHAAHQPYVEEAARQIRASMPGRANGRARMNAMFDANANFKRT